MEDGERIPVVIEEPAESVGAGTLTEDGTLVIDVLASPACEPEPVPTDGDIVVCASREGQELRGSDAAASEPVEGLSRKLNVKLGPVELGSIRNRDGTYAFGLRSRF